MYVCLQYSTRWKLETWANYWSLHTDRKRMQRSGSELRNQCKLPSSHFAIPTVYFLFSFEVFHGKYQNFRVSILVSQIFILTEYCYMKTISLSWFRCDKTQWTDQKFVVVKRSTCRSPKNIQDDHPKQPQSYINQVKRPLPKNYFTYMGNFELFVYWWILYIKTEFAKVCSGLEIFQVANTARILTVLVP